MCINTHHWLNQAFAVAEGYLANRILVHCLVPVLKNGDDDSKSPMVPVLKATMIVNVLVPVWIY